MQLSLAVLAFLPTLALSHYTFPITVIAGNTSTEWEFVRMTSNHHNSAAVEDVTLQAIRCLEDSTRQPSAIANVRAGSEIIFKATNTMGHPGPQLAYMARVPTGSNATTWKGDGNVWFKVSEKGATIDSTGVHFETGMNHLSAKIPKAVPNGEYLVRVEHIALHKPGLPQNYVACAQVKVTGGGSGKPNPLVAFPGAYKKTDPGLKFNMYGSPVIPYPMPGPPVWSA